jgi:hypothetical protein
LVLDDVCSGLTCTLYGPVEHCFISHTTPPDDCCDFVAVWIDGIEPTRQFPIPDDVTPDRCGEMSRMVSARIRLRRSCYPVVRDNAKQPFPPPSEMQAAAEGLLIDANVTWCRLASGIASGLYTPDGSGCLDYKLAGLVMDRPRGGCAGFTATLLMELDPCCDGCC